MNKGLWAYCFAPRNEIKEKESERASDSIPAADLKNKSSVLAK